MIRFAFAKHISHAGIFHEKIGIFDFPWGEKVAFTGSANETISGHERNYESIDVYRSWISPEQDRVTTKIEQFDEAWNNKAYGLSVRLPTARVISRLKAAAPDELPVFTESMEEQETSDADAARWRHQDEAARIFLEKHAGIQTPHSTRARSLVGSVVNLNASFALHLQDALFS